MSIVRVSGNPGYDVVLESGLMSRVETLLREMSKATRVGIVTDINLAQQWLPQLAEAAERGGFEPIPVILDPGEMSKSLAGMSTIYDAFLSARFERTTPILALGGGVIGDAAGFAAATLLRGVPIIQVPTTLLAMVDSSVGGKTGINHARGKNLIGAFYSPKAVWADLDTLKTLPRRELNAGLAECVKHALLQGEAELAWLEANLDRILALDAVALDQLVARNVAFKASIVQQDPFEHGIRAHLNLGHTFGHAIEIVGQYALLHGECVALGLVAMAELSIALGLLQRADVDRIRTLLTTIGLPTSGMSLPMNVLLAAMRSDKKVVAGNLRFIVLDGWGKAVVREDVSENLATRSLESLR